LLVVLKKRIYAVMNRVEMHVATMHELINKTKSTPLVKLLYAMPRKIKWDLSACWQRVWP
jgi:hypothetical protein